jgi:hypothetical protein
MKDELHQFMLAQSQAIRADVATLAASIVDLRRDVEVIREELSPHSNRIETLARDYIGAALVACCRCVSKAAHETPPLRTAGFRLVVKGPDCTASAAPSGYSAKW